MSFDGTVVPIPTLPPESTVNLPATSSRPAGALLPIPTVPVFVMIMAGEVLLESEPCVNSARLLPLVPILAQFVVAAEVSWIKESVALAPNAAAKD